MSVAEFRSRVLLLLLVLLAGCAGPTPPTTWPAQFVGRSLGEVIATYGTDYRCITLDAEQKRLTWRYPAQGVVRNRNEPATPAVTPEGIGVMSGRQGLPRPMQVDCRLSFDLDATRKVVSWRVDGEVASLRSVGATPLSASMTNSPAPLAGAETCLAAVTTLGHRTASQGVGAAQPAALECGSAQQ